MKIFYYGMALTMTCLTFSACQGTAPAERASAAEIVSVKKIWNAAPHNAFTDLIRYKDKWFCAFREGETHAGIHGKIRVLISSDGQTWESAALLAENNVDLRDAKLSITPDHRLMLLLGGLVRENKVQKELQSRVAFSDDGRAWTTPRRILEKDDWLWRVTWHQGRAFGIAYTVPTPSTEQTPEWNVRLVESDDGVHFRTVTKFNIPNRPNESTVRFLKNGHCVALVRREATEKSAWAGANAWIGVSKAPYKNWKWNEANMFVGGPNFIVLSDGSMVAGGRQQNPAPIGSKTFIGAMDFHGITPQLILPSSGDSSYPGFVWHEDLLWVSYYSSHEGKSSIYLAKVKLAPR